MGRKTMDSLGKPLKGRLNVVISSKPASVPDGFVAYSSISEALKSINSHKEIAVIGGAKIYEQFMPLADRLILTRVDSRFNNADVFFPEIHPNKWNKEFSEFHPSDERHKYAFTFEMYSRT
jgi:dihydrofolate reductase